MQTSKPNTRGNLMPSLKLKCRQAAGKVRRFLLLHFRKRYVDQQIAHRQGECNQCGNCCEILFRCPFLVKVADGQSLCSIYDNRPGQCAAFPINERCLSEVEFDCSYTFAEKQSGLQIEPAPLLHQAD